VNSTHFQTPKICQNLSFLCSPKYEVFCAEIWHTCRIHLYIHSDLFSEFFETKNIWYFRIFQKMSYVELELQIEFPLVLGPK
jgi:hypothetical protein